MVALYCKSDYLYIQPGGSTLKKILNYDTILKLLLVSVVTLDTILNFTAIRLTVHSFLLLSLFWPLKNSNWFIVSVWLIVKPLFVSFLLMIFIGIIVQLLNLDNNLFVGIFLIIFLLFSVPVVSCGLFLFNWKDRKFRETVKVSLEVNNTLCFLIISVTLTYFIFDGNLSISSLLPQELVKNLGQNLFSRNFLTDLLNVLTFPFLVSNSLLKALIEYLQWKDKKQLTDL